MPSGSSGRSGRKAREEGREEPRPEQRRDDTPRIDREQAEEYITALRARAEEQGVDLGRMGGFGGRGGRGRRG